jgi:hypothetical protein
MKDDCHMDPLHLENADREIRINKMREELIEMSGGHYFEDESDSCPPEVKEKFLEQVLAFEKSEKTTHLEMLTRLGHEFPSPEALQGRMLADKLWELIEAMASIDVYIESTDHLSDQELYTYLWRQALREEVPDISCDGESAWHLDPLGGCSADDLQLWLQYYADEGQREDFAREMDGQSLPEHKDPPYDRDRHLPLPHGI